MWSMGCILAELYLGYPLFPGEDEVEQFACIMEVLGVPPKKLMQESTRGKLFCDADSNLRIVPNSRGRKRRPSSKDLMSALQCTDTSFVSFLEGCLRWNANERFTPEEALQHPWITAASTSLSSPRLKSACHYTPRLANEMPQSSCKPSQGGFAPHTGVGR
mmetsp:Transcript_63616/g.141889  ORF Transcript_63616/g.141889 Transcript_63616/m.141889 type:complete len:161 (+) Transcript_63616:902-1384(+)